MANLSLKLYLNHGLVLLGLALLVACGGSDPTTANKHTPATGTAAHTADLTTYVLTTKPTEPISITKAKETAKEGQEITVRCRIGGQPEPFIEGMAAMLVADDDFLVACDAIEDDPCKLPWDYCCEDKTKITKGLATVQIVGKDGRPLQTSLKGQNDWQAGQYLVVTGSVASTVAGNLVINATGIYHDRERKVVMRKDRTP